jgi:hypothetical protein
MSVSKMREGQNGRDGWFALAYSDWGNGLEDWHL